MPHGFHVGSPSGGRCRLAFSSEEKFCLEQSDGRFRFRFLQAHASQFLHVDVRGVSITPWVLVRDIGTALIQLVCGHSSFWRAAQKYPESVLCGLKFYILKAVRYCFVEQGWVRRQKLRCWYHPSWHRPVPLPFYPIRWRFWDAGFPYAG